jgi:hypothetical protein
MAEPLNFRSWLSEIRIWAAGGRTWIRLPSDLTHSGPEDCVFGAAGEVGLAAA